VSREIDERPRRSGAFRPGVQLLPLTAGNIVLAYNVPGVRSLPAESLARFGKDLMT
jgi:hypothetical protein